jgi:glycogen synthase
VDVGPQRPMAPVDLEPFMPRIASDLAQTWLSQSPDVVHAYHWASGVPAAEAAAAAWSRPFRVRVLFTSPYRG